MEKNKAQTTDQTINQKRKAKLTVAAVAVFLCIVGAYLNHRRHSKSPMASKSVEEILKERNEKAGLSLNTPLGQAFVARDWTKFEANYQPKSQFFELGEIIRSGYVQNRFQPFTANDYTRLNEIVFHTLAQLNPKDQAQSGILVTQFNRWPLPAPSTPIYAEFKKTALSKDASEFIRRLALFKIVEQDLTPSPELVSLYAQGLAGHSFISNRSEWFHSMDYIRSVSVRTTLAKDIIQIYPKMSHAEQPIALSFLSRAPQADPAALKKFALQAFSEKSPAYVESALRVVVVLANKKELTEKEKAVFYQKISTLPIELKSPFAEARIHELQGILK